MEVGGDASGGSAGRGEGVKAIDSGDAKLYAETDR